MSIVLAIFPMLLLVIFPFVPESHVYFLKIGQTKEAEESLVRLRGNEADYDIRGEMKTIQEEIDQNRDRGGSFIDSLSSVANRRALVAVLGTMGFHQLCGVNAVVFYVEQIFTAAETSIAPSVGAIIVVCFQCIGGFLSLKIIDRAGRKYFLILSAVGMLMGHCGLGMFFHLRKYNMGSSLGFLPIGCVIMFIVAFTLGYGNIPFMLSHELLPPELRGVGSGMAIVVAWTISFLVTYVFPIAVVHLGDYITFYILGAANAIAILFTLQFVPETRGKTLIDIQEILSR
ncbi:hypothetical protein WA026_017279 [Henosepilachna vigintioctopunctata]|uniref:Major facilitator superfamily (MFS) profile domain-containing protein n=1 Tax=Henosepilachna vigintioctopunctata TaxID=420089 RepID=A0AAW1UKZ5_9CUCU